MVTFRIETRANLVVALAPSGAEIWRGKRIASALARVALAMRHPMHNGADCCVVIARAASDLDKHHASRPNI